MRCSGWFTLVYLNAVCLTSVFPGIVIGQGPAKELPIPETIEFNRDIRPLLSDNCFQCHGPDKNKREADLRLDTEAGLKGHDGKPGALVPGKPDESELIKRILSTDPDKKMPPAATGKVLTARDIALLKKWVAQGGRFEGHWAFLPLHKDASASLPNDQAAVAKVDELVARGLTEQNLKPSPVADKITLLRRIHFDLIGLPPSEKDIATFLQDQSPNAYEKEVDRLLQSPHFGERLAMWWLDLVRYADTVGYHGDQEMSVAPFRQYVIQSFNANKPFHQFTAEQLAGDLMPNPTREQLIASGYNRLGMMSAEGGVQDKEYLAKYIAERVRNASGTWLGVTIGCAECHDHKFDPFTTKDFYRFEAFFADIKERGLYSGANSDGNWGPNIKVPTQEQETQLAAFDAQIAALKQKLETATPELAAAQAEWEKTQIPWTVLKPESVASAEGVTLASRPDGSILASGKSPATDTYTLVIKQLPPAVTAIRLEVLPDPSLPQKGPGRAGNGNFVLSEFVATVKPALGDDRPVAISAATASYEQTGAAGDNPYKKWAIAAAIDGDAKGKKWGWAVMEKVGQPHVAIFETASDLTLDNGDTLTIALQQNLDNPQHTIGLFRLSATTAPRPVKVTDAAPPNISAILAIAPPQRSEPQLKEVAAYFRTIAPSLQQTRSELATVEKSRKDLDAKIRAGGEFKARGFTLPSGSVKVDEDRYRLPTLESVKK